MLNTSHFNSWLHQYRSSKLLPNFFFVQTSYIYLYISEACRQPKSAGRLNNDHMHIYGCMYISRLTFGRVDWFIVTINNIK